MAVRRYRSQPLVSSLMVLLTSNLLSDKPPPSVPGKRRQTARASFCPTHKSVKLQPLNNGSGNYYCEECPGRVFNPPEKNR